MKVPSGSGTTPQSQGNGGVIDNIPNLQIQFNNDINDALSHYHNTKISF